MTETQPWNNLWVITANGTLEAWKPFVLPSSSSASSLSSLPSLSSESSYGQKEMIVKGTCICSGGAERPHTPLHKREEYLTVSHGESIS